MEESLPGTVVIADMEAGLEHLTWVGGTLRHVDRLLVVALPEAKSLRTAERTQRLARQLGIPSVGLLANAVGPDDRSLVTSFAADRRLELAAMIPHDERLRRADRLGGCPLDGDPDAPAIRALAGLADGLEIDFGLAPVGAQQGPVVTGQPPGGGQTR